MTTSTIFLGLIVARIWRVNHNTKDLLYESEFQARPSNRRRSNKLQHVIRTVVESGLLYTGTSLITFVTYITNSVAVYVATDMARLKLFFATTDRSDRPNRKFK
jgi:hypothetical protein